MKSIAEDQPPFGRLIGMRLTPDGEAVVVRTPLDIAREPTGL